VRIAGDDPDSRIHDFLGNRVEEKPIWADLYESFRDAVFPTRLRPLELTSTPVSTPDRMAVKTNPWAIGTATNVNGAVVAILPLMGFNSTINHLAKPFPGDKVHLSDFTLFAPRTRQTAGGGGGGGFNDPIDPHQRQTAEAGEHSYRSSAGSSPREPKPGHESCVRAGAKMDHVTLR